MNKLSHVGRFFYSLAFTVLGLLCLLHDDFIIGRPPAWPDTWLLNPALAYVSTDSSPISPPFAYSLEAWVF